ncbi:helix-turn-helix domain-containing protein [Miltoncostaea oceani]|uniref:helix-turn-helix domain-containing protein n=1 Tax=Miltoncostaea oceani TaxID=2843216 RepID=UPI001C3DA910|nr:helix-turn-helix domain-containing protein [Miltoncostaea oceani]
MNDEILTTAEAAAAMRVHERTVLRMIARGDLRGVKVGKGYRIRADELPTAPRPRPNPPKRRYRPSGSIGRIVADMEAAS